MVEAAVDTPELTVWDGLPPGLLETTAPELHRILSGPTLIHLPGRREPPLFVSVLLHGNETTGFEAVQALLRKYADRDLPRALSIFVGNVAAARDGVRRLDGQHDYNRVWPGGEMGDTPEGRIAAQVCDAMAARHVFASIDIHNNTGRNPHYGCVNVLAGRFLHLASLFSRTVVYFTRPRGVQSMAMARLCPAVTVECGQAGSEHSTAHALEFLEAGLHLSEIPDHPAVDNLAVYHTVARLRVADNASLSFGDGDADILLPEDAETLNFRELPVGMPFAQIRRDDCLLVEDIDGSDARARFLQQQDGELRTRVPVMPSMLTRDERVIRQDCLCYFMERLDVNQLAGW